MALYGTAISAPWIQEKYVRLLAHTVERYKVVSDSPLSVNFRCPICGDSKKSKRKARGFVFRTPDGDFRYKCHNCGDSRSLRSLLKTIDPTLYREYVAEVTLKPQVAPLESVREKDLRTTASNDQVSINVDLPRLVDLPESHPAVKYWTERRIPRDRMADAYWTDAYFRWVNDTLIPDKFTDKALARDCGRIVLPFRDDRKRITAMTARSVGGQEPKYVAIKLLHPVSPFGSDRVDPKSTVIVLEGPIDSMFIRNAVAMGTSNRKVDFPNRIMVFDNEPRAPAIVSIMERAIADGETVVVWPKDVAQKDVNDMVLAGLDPESIIRSRAFSGLRARIELNDWRRDR